MTTYVDAGWTGTPDAVTAGLDAYGFQVNNDSSVSVIDPTLNTRSLSVAGYRVLDGVAYVLVRAPNAVPLPSGVTTIGAEHTTAISGVFMDDGTTPPSTISSNDFFNRFTQAETAAIWAAAVAHPPIGVGLINGLASGDIVLTGTTVAAWVAGLVSVGAITSARATVITTP